MGHMKDMHNADLMAFFDYAEDYEIVAHRIATIPHPPKRGVSTQLMRGRQFLKVGIAFVYSVSQFCRRLRVLKLEGNIFEVANMRFSSYALRA